LSPPGPGFRRTQRAFATLPSRFDNGRRAARATSACVCLLTTAIPCSESHRHQLRGRARRGADLRHRAVAVGCGERGDAQGGSGRGWKSATPRASYRAWIGRCARSRQSGLRDRPPLASTPPPPAPPRAPAPPWRRRT
jgi:hypothetical protein